MIGAVRSVHALLPTVLLVATGLAGVGGAIWGRRERGLRTAIVGAFRALQIVVTLQALLGLVLWIAAGFALSMLWHVVLGSVAAAAASGVAALLGAPAKRRAPLLVAVAAVLFALVLVSLLTGPARGGTEAQREALLVEVRPVLELGLAESGGEMYRSLCQSCHGPEGTTLQLETSLRDLASRDADAFLVAAAYGKESMPGFRSSLRAQDLADLLAFSRTLGVEAGEP